MKCRKCSNILKEDSLFCDKCGQKVVIEESNDVSKETIDELEKTILADNIINSEPINNFLKDNIDVSDLAPDDIDDLIPKKKHTLLITLFIILVICGLGIFIYFDLINRNTKNKYKEKIDYQKIINEYGNSMEAAAYKYLSEDNEINSFDDIKNLIEYKKNNVSCKDIYINIDGSVYLANCIVNGKRVNEMYGMKKNILTKDDTDSCKTEYDNENNSISFIVDDEEISVYECKNSNCSLYETDSFKYNSCLDKIAVIKDGNLYHIYNYQAAQDVIDPIIEISSVKNNNKIIGFIVRDSVNGKYGYADNRGNIKIELKYDSLGRIYNGETNTNSYNNEVIIVKKDKKYGLIKLSNGTKVFDFKYDDVLVNDDKFVVKEEDKYYVVDQNMMRLINKGYDMIFAFDSVVVVNENNKLAIIDYKGKKIIDDEIDIYMEYNNSPNLEQVYGYRAYKQNNNIVIEVNKTNNESIRYVYSIDNKKLEISEKTL